LRKTLIACCLPLAVLASGCAKESSESPKATVAAIPEEEVSRGRQACEAYVERVCACAEQHPDMAEECALSKARPKAFELNLELGTAPGLSKVELQAVKVEARKIVAGCFEADSRLADTKCPRKAP